jgi:hypothetical protein
MWCFKRKTCSSEHAHHKVTMLWPPKSELIEMALINKDKLLWVVMCGDDSLVLLMVLLILLEGMACDL